MNLIESTDLEKFVITKQVNNQSNNFNFSQKQKKKNELCWGSGLGLCLFSRCDVFGEWGDTVPKIDKTFPGLIM